MKILIVEDDENKRSQVIDFINIHFKDCEISIAKSFQSGLRSIIETNVDAIFLDMTMPTYDIGLNEDGGRPQHYAGREILRQMNRKNIRISTWVVTGFDYFGEGESSMSREQLDTQLMQDHSSFYRGTIYFNAAMEDWKNELLKALIVVSQEVVND